MLHRDPQFDPVVRRMYQILPGAQVPFGRLDRGMPEQHLDLLKLATGGPAQLGARPATIMRGDAGDTSIGGIPLEHLPDDFLGHGVTLNLVATVHRSEYSAVRQTGCGGPSIDRHLHPRRHRHSSDAAVLANEVDNAPAAIALLDVRERQSRDLGTPEPAAEQDGEDCTITQPLCRRYPVRRGATAPVAATASCRRGCRRILRSSRE